MLPSRGQDAKKEGSHCRRLPFFLYRFEMKISIILIFFLSQFIMMNCSKKSKNISKQEMIKKIQVGDPQFKEIEEPSKLIDCSLYISDCKKVYRATVLGYEVFLVEFSSEYHASREASRKKTISVSNWLIDNIQNEKLLQSFFIKYLQIENTNQDLSVD